MRLTGSGLGCSTWPNCEPGQFTPRYSPEMGLRPFIEFGNRTLTGVLGVFAIAVLGRGGLGMAIGALIGGLAVTALVLAFARAGTGAGSGAGGATSAMGSQKVIVAGIAIAALAGVLVAQMVLGLGTGDLQTVAVWTSGSLSAASWTRIGNARHS